MPWAPPRAASEGHITLAVHQAASIQDYQAKGTLFIAAVGRG